MHLYYQVKLNVMQVLEKLNYDMIRFKCQPKQLALGAKTSMLKQTFYSQLTSSIHS